MNPNGQVPLDYLNQIAPQAPKKPMFTLNLRTIILAALAVIALIILIATIAGGLSSSSKEPWQRMAARLNATVVVVDGATSRIKSSQLRSLNSDLKLYLTNTQRDLAKPLLALSVDTAKLPKDIVSEENGTGITERLENGRLNARYDSTYAREMTYQVATILSQLQILYSGNISAQTKATIQAAYDNLLPTYKTLSSFSASNE
ncbi:MAG: hypothetical protein ACOH18_04075 [Candidatus Saccharimonadaceae bacterium]